MCETSRAPWLVHGGVQFPGQALVDRGVQVALEEQPLERRGTQAEGRLDAAVGIA